MAETTVDISDVFDKKKQRSTKAKKDSAKTPAYKKWWFWVLVAFLLLVGVGASGAPSDEQRLSEEAFENASGKSEEEKKEDEQVAAADAAVKYLDSTIYSKGALVEALEKDGYGQEAIDYALEYVDHDWNQDAVKRARFYLTYGNKKGDMTKAKLINQLKYEGFTQEEAIYAANRVGF